MNTISYTVPDNLQTAVEKALADWQQNNKTERLREKDASLWSNRDEAQWLDWLTVIPVKQEAQDELLSFAREISTAGFRQVVLLGMGGSSMGPEVLRDTFGAASRCPDLMVLDSTDPDQIRMVDDAVDLAQTLFMVASKSGSTLEPNILKAWFFQRVVDAVGANRAAGHFVAITDPGSSLEQVAKDEGWRRIFYGNPQIGGRFSVLSNFGLVPAALLGVDLPRYLENTLEMVQACLINGPAADNPGVVLGAILGEAAGLGRDKLMIVASPGVASIGAWLEQLVAESLGKEGKSVIPVDGETLAAADEYGNDRVFVYLRLDSDQDADQEAAIGQLESAGHPVVRITLQDAYGLGQEFFRWEIATAVAGAIMQINPFDQPDVEASKAETRKLMSGGQLPAETPLLEDEHCSLFTDAGNAAALREAAGEGATLADYVQAHLDRAEAGDYLALLAYIARNDAHSALLQRLRQRLRDRYKLAVCLGFGPRFLHSTGQAYKGGANNGVFLQITCDHAVDLPVPGHDYSFGMVEAAQARGDFEVLAERGRRVLRVHLGPDIEAGLEQLCDRLFP